MTENAQQDVQSVVDLLTQDEDLRKVVRSAQTPRQVVEILADAGFTVSIDDVVVATSGEVELGEAELDTVSGGTSPYVSVYVACQPSPPSQHFVFGQCIP